MTVAHVAMDPQVNPREEVLRLFLQNRGMLSAFLFSLAEDWDMVEESLQDTAVFVCSRWRDFVPGTDFAK